MEQDDKFQFAHLPFERGEILFSRWCCYDQADKSPANPDRRRGAI